MLANYLIGSEKVVLFIGKYWLCVNSFRKKKKKKTFQPNLKYGIIYLDNNSYEPFSNDILQSIARSSPTVVYPKATDIPTIETSFKADIENQIATTEKPNVILASVSRLELGNSVHDVIRLVHFLKQNTKIGQIFIWCSRKNIQDDKIIPFLQYLASIEVIFKDESNLQIFTKRHTGSVTRKVSQNSKYLDCRTIATIKKR